MTLEQRIAKVAERAERDFRIGRDPIDASYAFSAMTACYEATELLRQFLEEETQWYADDCRSAPADVYLLAQAEKIIAEVE